MMMFLVSTADQMLRATGRESFEATQEVGGSERSKSLIPQHFLYPCRC